MATKCRVSASILTYMPFRNFLVSSVEAAKIVCFMSLVSSSTLRVSLVPDSISGKVGYSSTGVARSSKSTLSAEIVTWFPSVLKLRVWLDIFETILLIVLALMRAFPSSVASSMVVWYSMPSSRSFPLSLSLLPWSSKWMFSRTGIAVLFEIAFSAI